MQQSRSQVLSRSGKNYLLPLKDPENVDERRKKVGFEPIADYLQRFQITWNVEEYKRNLPEIKKPPDLKKLVENANKSKKEDN